MAKETYDYSCVMWELPSDLAQEITAWSRKHIPDEWLNEEAGGRELESHVTIKYGLLTSDLEEVEPHLPTKPMGIQLGEVGRFTSKPDYDVIMIEVLGDDLHDLNHEISLSLPNEDEHKDYHPHITLAYVKKGKGVELEGAEPFADREMMVDTLLWSSHEGEKKTIQVDEPVKSHVASWLWSPFHEREKANC